MNNKHVISVIGILSTSLTVAGCTDKTETETEEENDETVSHESIDGDWSATSMSYEDEIIPFPYEDCETMDDETYCTNVNLSMMIEESQTALITMSYSVTQNGIVLDDESESYSFSATVVLKEVSNTYGIILEDQDELFGSLTCTLSADELDCLVAEEDQSITFSQ